ncbi:hypothetical protein PR048_023967 [Dryococelus australis]|uniref:Uncharacterized protein n=1 Tax=Dryococelus australis TaxID=614101 RepID=A0ABQ9GVL4_9NEOP|nr:hypothetical protein PR048_023967 [Dryococelus australis]
MRPSATKEKNSLPVALPDLQQKATCIVPEYLVALYCTYLRLSDNVFYNADHLSRVAAVSERLACSPPTKANRVQSPAGSLPDSRMWESCRMVPLVGGFSRGSPAFRRCSILTSFTHIGSQDLAREIPEKTRRPAASTGTIPAREIPEATALRVEPIADEPIYTSAPHGQQPRDKDGKTSTGETMPLVGGFLSGISRFRLSILASITHVGSQDLAVKSRPNHLTFHSTGEARNQLRHLHESNGETNRKQASNERSFRKCVHHPTMKRLFNLRTGGADNQIAELRQRKARPASDIFKIIEEEEEGEEEGEGCSLALRRRELHPCCTAPPDRSEEEGAVKKLDFVPSITRTNWYQRAVRRTGEGRKVELTSFKPLGLPSLVGLAKGGGGLSIQPVPSPYYRGQVSRRKVSRGEVEKDIRCLHPFCDMKLPRPGGQMKNFPRGKRTKLTPPLPFRTIFNGQESPVSFAKPLPLVTRHTRAARNEFTIASKLCHLGEISHARARRRRVEAFGKPLAVNRLLPPPRLADVEREKGETGFAKRSSRALPEHKILQLRMKLQNSKGRRRENSASNAPDFNLRSRIAVSWMINEEGLRPGQNSTSRVTLLAST